MHTLTRDPGTIQPGKFIARELDHLSEDDLVEMMLYMTRTLTARLGITIMVRRGGASQWRDQALHQERAEPAARSIIRRLRERGGTL